MVVCKFVSQTYLTRILSLILAAWPTIVVLYQVKLRILKRMFCCVSMEGKLAQVDH